MKLINFTSFTALGLSILAFTATLLPFRAYVSTSKIVSFSSSMASSHPNPATPETAPSTSAPTHSNFKEADEQIDESTPEDSTSETSDLKRSSFHELGICRSYIPSRSEPDSFEYQEGMYRCQYGL